MEQAVAGASAGGIRIERAGEKHAYSISAMTAHYFPYAGFSHSIIMGRLTNPAIVYLVALEGNHCVGFIDYELKPDAAQILGLAVLDEYRGRGIAKMLLEEALRLIRGEGKKRIDLLVAEENCPAIGLYSKYGFSPAGKLGRKLWDKEIMVYSLRI